MGEFRKIKPPTFNAETKTRAEAEPWLLGMLKDFNVYDYSNNMKSHMDIYNLNGKAKIWWQDLKLVKGLKWKNIEWKDFKK